MLKVENITPEWISDAKIFSSDLQNFECDIDNFDVFKDNEALRTNLHNMKINHLFPVQDTVIPFIINEQKNRLRWRPHDVCVAAPTGSGKTLAYILPIIMELTHIKINTLQAIVILPTMHLAIQVFNCFLQMLQDIDLKVTLIVGKSSFEEEQRELVANSKIFGPIQKTNIMITTPGRLVDHLKQTNGLNLRNLRFLVIDEVDRVLSNINQDWLHHLKQSIGTDNFSNQTFKPLLCIKALSEYQGPQKLLFSATFPHDPDLLEKVGLFEPKLFSSAANSRFLRPNELSEKILLAPLKLKPLIFFKFIQLENLTNTLVFVDSTEAVYRLTYLLEIWFKDTKIRIEKLCSNLSVHYQKNIIQSFSNGIINILVCTDVLARGIDLANVLYVVNYDTPRFIETYIHRSGRTARAGREGNVITLVEPKHELLFCKMLKDAGLYHNMVRVTIDSAELINDENRYSLVLNELKDMVEKRQTKKNKKIVALKRKSRGAASIKKKIKKK